MIKSIIDDDKTTPEIKVWFLKFFDDDLDEKNLDEFAPLKDAFRDKKLYRKHMEELIKLPYDDLPLLDLNIPDP